VTSLKIFLWMPPKHNNPSGREPERPVFMKGVIFAGSGTQADFAQNYI
jgi:hypothetical protein